MAAVETTLATWSTQEFEADKIYYELCYRKAPRRVSWSSQNMIAWAIQTSDALNSHFNCTFPNIGIFSPCRLPSTDTSGLAWSFVNKNNLFLLDGVEIKHHPGSVITDLVWNQTGSILASVDQRGKIAIWMMNNFVNHWKCICDIDLGEGIIIFSWIDCVRMYSRVTESRSSGPTLYKRGEFKGPRNQFGEFAFITITSYGKVNVWYQKGNKQFSKINGSLQYTHGRISHADIIINNDGRYILATYIQESCPRVVMFHEISIDILRSQVHCRPISSIHLTAQINDPSFSIGRAPVLHLKLLPSSKSHGIRLIIVAVERLVDGDSLTFNSNMAMWELVNSQGTVVEGSSMQDKNEIQIDEPSTSLRFMAGAHIPKKLVTNLWAYKQELFVGFSNGLIQFRDCTTLQTLNQAGQNGIKLFVDSRFPTYNTWIPSSYHDQNDGVFATVNAIAEFATSPNGTLLLCGRYSGKLDCLDMADINLTKVDLMDSMQGSRACADKLTLCILNSMDHTDLENIMKKLSILSEEKKDLLEITLEETFSNISSVFPNGFETSSSSDFLIRLFGLQLSLLKSCGCDNITYLNTLCVLHLRALEITFKNSITPDDTFVDDSLRSLASLTSWILDFFVYFIRNIYLLYSTTKKGRVLATEKSHIVLLYHSISRSALKNLLSLVGKFKDYIENSSDSSIQDIHRSLNYSFEKWPLKLESLESFIKDSSAVIEKTMQADRQKTIYRMILRSVLQTSLHGTLKEIEQIFKTSFSVVNKVKLYVYDTKWIESDSIDIVLKSRVDTILHYGTYKVPIGQRVTLDRAYVAVFGLTLVSDETSVTFYPQPNNRLNFL
ncbi:18577_t:CDS:10 [Acaulospora morrowiae]|uniref:Mediator of RNA polymerase II transcription subunit 16 n=1 Tax=Acaulospora morrowiae TaxID=94023 RepID=A0A9N8VUT0_9GLOM|nr:18577_t:CDS:10 [Acaulospora morrowiae]